MAMPQSYVNLTYHIVFSTKDRTPLIKEVYQTRLHEYIGGIIRAQGGIALAINGMPDHVHILAKLRQDKPVSNMIRDFKANSSGWMHSVFPELRDFSWQNGYGAFTVNSSGIETIRRYIADQQLHHQNRSYRNEFVELLNENNVEFDEKYLDF
jgi:REP-associated tyrosine transposase